VIDPYIDPRSGLLRNRAGIVDAERLRRSEAATTKVAMMTLAVEVLPGQYDLSHLQAFHRRIFGRLYATQVFDQLADEKHLRRLPPDRFVGRVTHYFAEVNAIHPFREGNGRTQRAFFHQLAREAGWPIDWSGLEAERNTSASIASLRGDNSPLRAMPDELIADGTG
jgi:cell filamentation protein